MPQFDLLLPIIQERPVDVRVHAEVARVDNAT